MALAATQTLRIEYTVKKPQISLFRFDLRLNADLVEEYLQAKFLETRSLSLAISIFAAVSVVLRWSWDYVIDPVHAPQTISLRLVMCGILLVYPLCILMGLPPKQLVLILYGGLLVCQLLFFIILSRLDQGITHGVSGFLYSVSGAVMALFSYSLKTNVLGCLTLVCFPNLWTLLGMAQNFNLSQYNTLIIPMCLAVIFLAFCFDCMYRRIFLLQREVKALATTDELTTLHNRRSFTLQASVLLQVAQRYTHPISLIMLDIDHFKSVNDTYGHLVGDHVIQQIATLFQQQLRQSDLAARWGGEEFVALLNETHPDSAYSIAERVRLIIAATPTIIADGDAAQLAVTISVGVAGFERAPADLTLPMLLKRADDALYQAKHAGRNCTVAHELSSAT